MNWAKIHSLEGENGMVSIIVTMVIMIVLSITVIGFAQLMRREQRQVLDRQLNTQAFYAAESGVNDAVAKLKTDPTFFTNDCKDWTGLGNSNNVSDDTSHSVTYSCLLINPHPTTLEYTNIGLDKSEIIPIDLSNTSQLDSSPFKSLHVSWQDTTGTEDVSGCSPYSVDPFPAFPSAGNWANQPNQCPGILRIDIVKLPANGSSYGSFDRNWLINNTATAYLYPTTDGTDSPTIVSPDLGYGFSQQGRIVSVNCGASSAPPDEKQCKAVFNLDGSFKYYLRIKSIYKPNSVSISALATAGQLMQFQGAQAIVDSTGKANDVLKRIQVRVPTSILTSYSPEYDIDSLGSLCKRLGVAPPNPPDGATVYVVPFTDGSPAPDASCNPN